MILNLIYLYVFILLSFFSIIFLSKYLFKLTSLMFKLHPLSQILENGVQICEPAPAGRQRVHAAGQNVQEEVSDPEREPPADHQHAPSAREAPGAGNVFSGRLHGQEQHVDPAGEGGQHQTGEEYGFPQKVCVHLDFILFV